MEFFLFFFTPFHNPNRKPNPTNKTKTQPTKPKPNQQNQNQTDKTNLQNQTPPPNTKPNQPTTKPNPTSKNLSHDPRPVHDDRGADDALAGRRAVPQDLRLPLLPDGHERHQDVSAAKRLFSIQKHKCPALKIAFFWAMTIKTSCFFSKMIDRKC